MDTPEELRRRRQAEEAFAAFKAGLSTDLRRELESAITEAVREYSPTNRENRFVVGGAVERIMAAGMRAAGVPVGNLGHDGLGADLSVYVHAVREQLLSLKATFADRPSQHFRLVNFLSTAKQRAMHPTLFLLPRAGLVLAHEGYETIADAVELTDDAMTIKASAVIRHAQENPHCAIEMDVPKNDGIVRRVASADVAEAILSRPHFPLLGAAVTVDDEDDVAVQLAQMAVLHRGGQLSDDEFVKVKQRLLG